MMSGSYYAVIPAKVLHDKDLLKYPKSILLYGHIANLANQKGYCWATNKYFMEQLGVKSATTITDYLNLLVYKGFIKKKNIYKEGTKQIEKRIISIDTGRPIPVDCNTPITPERSTPIPPDCKENNTSINNTSNNNSSSTACDSLDNSTKDIESKQNAFEKYQIYVGMLSGRDTPIFIEYVHKLGDEVVGYAIDNMLSQTATPNFNYLNQILKKYEQLGIDTVEKAEELERQHQASKKQTKTRKKKKSNRINTLPF